MHATYLPSRWTVPAVFALSLTLLACSGSPSATSTQLSPSSAVTASPASSPTTSPLGLVATTEPADAAPRGAITVSLTAFHFEPSALTVKAGTVVFFVENKDEVPAGSTGTNHTLTIGSVLGQPLANTGYVHSGEAAVFTVEGLVPGEYVVWCSVPEHADMGMVGTLTVTP
jgi:plastocyanin